MPVNEGFEELVHIIPLGYEIDRAVRPFEEMKAHRVYLISMADNEKYNSPEEIAMTNREHEYEERVKNILSDQGIYVITYRIDMFDIPDIIRLISDIIITEQTSRNRIYVNMSACGRLTSVGATLAAMAHGVHLYYVRADRYAAGDDEIADHGLSICTSSRIWTLDNIRILLPAPLSIKILDLLTKSDSGLYADELITCLIEQNTPGYDQPYWARPARERRRIQSNYLTKLNNNNLSKLEKNGYITREKVGRRSHITITGSGQFIAGIVGYPNGLPSHLYS